MKKATMMIAGFLAAPLMAMGLVAAVPAGDAYAADLNLKSGLEATAAAENATKQDIPTLVKTVINMLLFLIGVISVVMIIIGGIRYATSNGDANSVTAAKNTILYAIVGLVVALFAYAIVNFVVQQIN